MDHDELPGSVEEAGALLGAAILGYGRGGGVVVPPPPKGMHSTFSAMCPVPSTDLFLRLHALRALLRRAPIDEPLLSAPSLIEGVLAKLLGVSSSVAAAVTAASSGGSSSSLGSAAANAAAAKQRSIPVPPMLSKPLRKLWVDCVVLCHRLGDGISGANAPRVNLFAFCRKMMALAATNPRSARAAGGTRVAALEALASLLQEPKLASQMASWALEIITLAQRSLKSLGNGEPGFRVAAVRAACAAVVSCRISSQKLRPVDGESEPEKMLLRMNAIEDKAISECVRLLRLAVADKFPEVRRAAGSLAALLAPMAILANNGRSQSGSDPASFSPTLSLEDIMLIAMKNLDDEKPDVAAGWAEALARCICTGVEYCSRRQAETTSRRDVEGGADGSGPSDSAGGGSGAEPTAAATAVTALSNRFAAARKMVQVTTVCSNTKVAMDFIVNQFVKAGGELMAAKAGGAYSVGGRAVRLGFTRCLIHILRLQSSLNSIGEGRAISIKEAISIILKLVGPDMDAQLQAIDRSQSSGPGFDATSVAEQATTTELAATAPVALFGQAPKISHSDAGIARMSANRVLRQGISEIASESMQLSILHELIHLASPESRASLNGNQLQVLLVEFSHLVVALGEATTASVDEISPALVGCLGHHSHGVRHEAAVACAALASVFPDEGRKLVSSCVDKIQMEHAKLMAHISANPVSQSSDSGAARLLRFRRSPPKEIVKKDGSLKHQYLIHGWSLMSSMIVCDLPALPGGLPPELLAKHLSVAEVLVSSLLNDVMSGGNPSATCTCVRAGFALICGSLACGPNAIAPHIALIFGLWQKCTKTSKRNEKFMPGHDLLCIDALLLSIVAFLKYSSELLLSIPDALSRTSIILEQLLPQFLPNGRLGKTPENSIAASRLHSAKASLMESFAWLPPGSYPMVADDVFSFAALHIRSSIESGIPCSIIQSLVNNEDSLLDAKSFCAATHSGQVGGARDLEHDAIFLTAEPAHHSDRESVFFLLDGGRDKLSLSGKIDTTFRGNRVLGSYVGERQVQLPTPLHEVGTWRPPIDPSCSCKVRLVDSAIQAFAATFGLKAGKEQQRAMQMLQSFIPGISTQLTRTMGVTEQDRRAKSRDESASVSNIIAVILCCLKALPLHDATHNVPIGLGPVWMSKGKDLLLSLLPSASHLARRAAAEGLAMLATVGVSEDAHFLQSSVLHSLDEVIQANQHDGKQRQTPVESVSAARASSLLALACIQRTAFNIQKSRSERSRGRGTPVSESKDSEQLSQLPTFQMMSRVLPSIVCSGPRDFFGVRTYALHAFSVLLAYSNKMPGDDLNEEGIQLLKKGVELVEDNFLTSWTPALADLDRGNEEEKMAFESPFLAVLLRSATFLVPYLHHLQSSDSQIAGRFSIMAAMILEGCESHPAVICEAMALFEALASKRNLMPSPSQKISYSECPLLCSIPYMQNYLLSGLPTVEPSGRWLNLRGSMGSIIAINSTLLAMKGVLLSRIRLLQWDGMRTIACVYAALELACSGRLFLGETFHRSLAAPRDTEGVYGGVHTSISSENHCVRILPIFLQLEHRSPSAHDRAFLPWILFARALIMGSASQPSEDTDDEPDSYSIQSVIQTANESAASSAALVSSNPVRWQVKALAMQMASLAMTFALDEIRKDGTPFVASSQLDPKLAKAECEEQCKAAKESLTDLPSSRLVFHLSEIVTAACAASGATVEQAEMYILQESGIYLLKKTILGFGSVADPEQDSNRILDEFIPQLSSSIKQTLTLEKEDEMSHRIFMAGCETLDVFVRCGVTDDKAVLKRLIRSALPSDDEVGLVHPSMEQVAFSTRPKSNDRTAALKTIGKLWVITNAVSVNDGLISELDTEAIALGSTLASLAFDGLYILACDGLSTCGVSSKSQQKPPAQQKTTPGFWYSDISDIDSSVKFALSSKWSTFARGAIHFLCQGRMSDDPEMQSLGDAWLEKIVPLVIAGARDSIVALSERNSTPSGAGWATGVDPNAVLSDCIASLTAMLSAPEDVVLPPCWLESADGLVTELYKTIVLPLLEEEERLTKAKEESKQETDIKTTASYAGPDTISKICELFRAMSSSKLAVFDETTEILPVLLHPLKLALDESLNMDTEQNVELLGTSLSSLADIVARSKVPERLLKVLLSFVVQFISNEAYHLVKDPARRLLESCLSHKSSSASDLGDIAFMMAKSHNWEAWSIVCASGDRDVSAKSLSVVAGILSNSAKPQMQVSAVAAICKLIQNLSVAAEVVQQIVLSVCAEILGILQVHGTSQMADSVATDKTAVVSDCMKIVLVCYKQVTSSSAEEKIILGFLVVMFETLIAVIRYNGLPNHPPPQRDSNPAFGRMCAQAILHVARTTPAQFKSCMGVVSEPSRVVIEFAVRAEMNGYAAPASEAPKKKLSLKGFKK